ncbi:DUF2812 domain-containing protein [Clostridium sporogenes]|nr:DUF2812 domain-containing protein [Clostridium sporogenes]NFQ43425.1 DUF2812 domain-containing protein [Clostridium sporogenes]
MISMKNKYVMIGGFAFSEESDMEKLRNYAKNGWILESIVGGFFYKLRKDEPQDIIYSLDYQTDVNEEYFHMFKEAGWNIVISLGNEMHIFSAQYDTKPIYSDFESNLGKYISMQNTVGKSSIYSLIVGIILIILSFFINNIFLTGLLLIDFIVFIFSFMPYVAYSYRIKKMKKYNKNKKNL